MLKRSTWLTYSPEGRPPRLHRQQWRLGPRTCWTAPPISLRTEVPPSVHILDAKQAHPELLCPPCSPSPWPLPFPKGRSCQDKSSREDWPLETVGLYATHAQERPDWHLPEWAVRHWSCTSFGAHAAQDLPSLGSPWEGLKKPENMSVLVPANALAVHCQAPACWKQGTLPKKGGPTWHRKST